MKVGTLARALSLLLVLPSATVLSLTGGIDRTMKAGLALFLLGSMKTVMAADKTPVEDCADNMVCMATESCISGGTDQSMTIFKGAPISSDCKAILKIRPYSAKMYRVVLESRDPSVTEITLTRVGDPTSLFLCKVGLSQYKGDEMTLLNTQANLLKCDFLATDANSDIMSISSSKLKMSVNGNDFWTADEVQIQPNLKPDRFCDPVHAQYDPTIVADYSIDEFVLGLTDLTCRPSSHLETKVTGEEQFVKTTSVKCTAGKWTIARTTGNPIPLEKADPFSIRCATKICSLCEYPPQAAANALDVVDGSDGCKELKCKQHRLKVGDTLGDKAICKKNNDKAMWSLGGTLIEDSTTVVCFEKKRCDTSICDPSKSDRCIVDKYGLPVCTGSHLTFKSKRITIECDENTGKWKYNDGSLPTTELPANVNLTCSSSGSEGSEKTDPAAANVTAYAVGGVVGVIVLAAIVAFGIYWYKKKRVAKNGMTGKSKETGKSVNSQSKSVNSKEFGSVLPEEFTAVSPPLEIVSPFTPEGKRLMAEAEKQKEAAFEAAIRATIAKAKAKGVEPNDDDSHKTSRLRPKDDETNALPKDDETNAFMPPEIEGAEIFKEKGAANGPKK